jgi:hypothetical protein
VDILPYFKRKELSGGCNKQNESRPSGTLETFRTILLIDPVVMRHSSPPMD